jgi:hypothetical protein
MCPIYGEIEHNKVGKPKIGLKAAVIYIGVPNEDAYIMQFYNCCII